MNSKRTPPRKTTATTSGSSYAKPLRHRRQMAGKIRFLMAANIESMFGAVHDQSPSSMPRNRRLDRIPASVTGHSDS
jgi:hypothetical protein